MGWLSLATRVIPKLWRSGAKVTSTLWKGGSSVVCAVAKNPKTTAVASVATFAGWQKLSHPDESIGTAVGKTLRGGTDRTGDFAHDVVNGYTGENTVEQVKDTTNKVISEIKDTAAETKGLLGTFGDTLKGISSFIGNLFGGNGTNMFGNFFNNLASGKISGWGIGALIAAAYMVFGRTGLLGKVGGALMAMMMIGNNSQRQTQTELPKPKIKRWCRMNSNNATDIGNISNINNTNNMRKTLTVIGASLFASHAFADSITDGIGTAGDAIYSYTPYVQALGYVLASIIGIVAAFVIYYAIANNDRNVKKRILTWGGGCVAMLCMTIALPKFFDYQESGLLAGNTNSSGGSSGDFAGGDRWGKIDITIPDINNPIWRPDHRFDPILRPGTGIVKPNIKLN